ncbi:cupin domain-containing protein [Pelovirga terrestris]|uniref:Cupin domain-containing protein n=1 Tax=Pelovirga terrestris TaxID=2771352 RepID=A0A8J6QWZ7_9BACT|nr:cupin domain-containing protein [Pelovirga terrestris]MBD1399687.1 cupin domain-containing protein [Pelovirga terrestris]
MAYKDKTIIRTDDVSVRQMFLEVGAEVPWHVHTQVVDTMYCLQGEMKVELADPQETTVLSVGERCEISVGRPHRVSAAGTEPVSYLLIQGVGKYDFQKI